MQLSKHFSSLLQCFLLLSSLGGVIAQDVKCAQVFDGTQDSQPKAIDAYQCLISAPFNKTIASDLISYWWDTLQFHSTLAYLKNPPPGYQQPGVDLLAGLDLIQNQIDNYVFTNQYSFEAAVHSLLQRCHDFHIVLDGGLLDVFAFTPGVLFSSVSRDGIELPKIYDAQELYIWREAGSKGSLPSIAKINGQLAENYLSNYGSRNSYGALEPHGDYNQIMWSYAASIQGYSDPFSTPFYSGDEMTLEYSNGTRRTVEWRARYVGGPDPPIIKTGQDLFDWFVLGDDTQSDIAVNGDPTTATASTADATATVTDDDDDDDEAPDLTSVSTPTATSTELNYPGWGGAYPEQPDVVQPLLGEGSYVTGYLLNDTKLGVLSIPSFQLDQDPDAVKNYSRAVKEFITKSKDAGMTKILIDLQQNYGGESLLAIETFRLFFPNMMPYSGMRTRSFGLTDRIGTTITNYFKQHQDTMNNTVTEEFANDPWAVTNELDPSTNKNFSSWEDYYGPHADRDDYFSTVFRYNFDNPVFQWVAGGIDINDDSTNTVTAAYDAKDIVLLTDSICASTCDLFTEMMHHEAGVRTVVVGGLPQEGPMQARGSTRGAMSLNNFHVDTNVAYAASINKSMARDYLDRSYEVASITSLSFNFADQIRDKEYIPLQFMYEAADCRIFYTPDTFLDYTKLWNYAASAIFHNSSTCVARSNEHKNTMQTDTDGPSDEQLDSWAATYSGNVNYDDSDLALNFTGDPIEFWIGFNQDMGYKNGWFYTMNCIDGGARCRWKKDHKYNKNSKADQKLYKQRTDIADPDTVFSNNHRTTSSDKGSDGSRPNRGSSQEQSSLDVPNQDVDPTTTGSKTPNSGGAKGTNPNSGGKTGSTVAKVGGRPPKRRSLGHRLLDPLRRRLAL